MNKKQSWSHLVLGSLMISFVCLVGCTKDPNNNTNINPPAEKEDLSLNSYIALDGDTFRGAYNSKIEDTIIVNEKQMPVHDKLGNLHPGYSYVNYMKILFYGSNKDGSRSRDTIFRVSFQKGFIDTLKLNLEEMPMDFEEAIVECDNLGSSDLLIQNAKYTIFEDWLGVKWHVSSVFVDGSWGFRKKFEIEDSNSIGYLDKNHSEFSKKASLKYKKLIDGKTHRVFETEYYSAIESKYFQLIPVKVRIVLD